MYLSLLQLFLLCYKKNLKKKLLFLSEVEYKISVLVSCFLEIYIVQKWKQLVYYNQDNKYFFLIFFFKSPLLLIDKAIVSGFFLISSLKISTAIFCEPPILKSANKNIIIIFFFSKNLLPLKPLHSWESFLF